MALGLADRVTEARQPCGDHIVTDDTGIEFVIGRCSHGLVLVAGGDAGICAIALGDDQGALEAELFDGFPEAAPAKKNDRLQDWLIRVQHFIECPGKGLAVPLDIGGTAFQMRVWQALREIPAGETASYAQIARAIGSPKAVRAVARACAANRIAVAIPCHRVVRSDGSTSGYRWGEARKRALLAQEAAT